MVPSVEMILVSLVPNRIWDRGGTAYQWLQQRGNSSRREATLLRYDLE